MEKPKPRRKAQQKHRWEKDSRYYEVHIHHDLWGEIIMTKVWGCIDSPLGNVRHTPMSSYDAVEKPLKVIIARRTQHEYQKVI